MYYNTIHAVSSTQHMSHFLMCVDTHHHQSRFLLFDRCRTLSLCVCTNDSQFLSCFTNWTSRSSAASYNAEYSVSVISPVVLPEKRCFRMESDVMDSETLELEQIMSRYVLAFECSLAGSPCPPEPCSQNLTPRPPCLCMSAKVLCHHVVFPALGTHPAIQKWRKTLNGSDPF